MIIVITYKNKIIMGCDIHSFAEVRRNGKWEKVEDKMFSTFSYNTSEPFGWRSYGMFGFLADVRNYSHIPPIQDRNGFPDDSEYLNELTLDWFGNSTMKRVDDLLEYYHSPTHIYLKTLMEFNYDTEFWDRRITKGNNGASLAENGEGEIITFREFLGTEFFNEIERLKTLGEPENVRVIMYFNS